MFNDATAPVPWKQSGRVPLGPKPAARSLFPPSPTSVSPPASRAPGIKRPPRRLPAEITDKSRASSSVQASSRRSVPRVMAAAAASRKAPSLVVAASMGAVEALKDQAGLCRWDYAIRSLYHRAAAPRIQALSAKLFDSMAAPAAELSRASARRPSAADARMRKAYHLVCWGPN